ncbi:hypothetical protein O3P69_002489 [Scylla paramamosain]|uniref:Sulfatase N-terminal domain-containing protein n=1 Tax=Scylla paramamosain TaxID=85552 RepID=A0AAW0UKX6_SCYPA
MKGQTENGEREMNLVVPPLPTPHATLPPPSPRLKQYTWPPLGGRGEGSGGRGERNGGGGGSGDVSEHDFSNLRAKELRKMEEEEKRMWKRMKNRRRKLRKMMKEEMKRRKRQMRLTSKRKRGSDRRPNIMLIVADDLGYNDVPWHNPDIRAPELLRLARHGVVLENHYVLPVCSPSRAALLTGRYPFRYGKQASFTPLSPTGLNTSLTLLPQHLQRLGYKTHLVGKWHLGHCDWAYTPTHRGFDSFYGYYLGSQGYYNRYKKIGMPPISAGHRNEVLGRHSVTTGEGADGNTDLGGNGGSGDSNTLEDVFSVGGDGEGLLKTKKTALREEQQYNEGGYDFRLNETPLTNVTGVYSNDLYAARVEEVIREHVRGSEGAPLFLMLSLQATHGPLEAPPSICGKRNSVPKHIENPSRKIFHDMVAAMDCVVGRMVKQLRRSHLYHNTIIVFTADNGGNFRVGGNNFPLRGSKGSLYEGGTRGVSLLHSPLLPNVGHRYRGLMHVVDWRETLLHAAMGPAHWPLHSSPDLQERGRKEAEEMVEEEREGNDDSLDLWSALLHNGPSPRTSFVYNLRKGPLRGAIRRRHWKLVVGLGGRYDGWVPPEDVGTVTGEECSSWNTPTTRHLLAHAHASDINDMVMLFNMRDDPLETTDLSGPVP